MEKVEFVTCNVASYVVYFFVSLTLVHTHSHEYQTGTINHKSPIEYVSESTERPVLMYSAALRFLAAAAECSTKENKDPPSLEDAFDAPKRMSKKFACLERFLKESDQWRQDMQRLTMMRNAISNVRAGISIALKEDPNNPRLSVGGMRREIERGLSFEDTSELVAAWEAKEKRFLKQFLETSELWSKVVMTNDTKKTKTPTTGATTTNTTTTATTTTTTTTTKRKRKGRAKTSMAHAVLRQIDTTMEVRDMYVVFLYRSLILSKSLNETQVRDA